MKRRDFVKAATGLVTAAIWPRAARTDEAHRDHGRLHLGLAGLGCGNGSLALIDWYPCRDVGGTKITRLNGGVLTGRAIWEAGIYLDPATAELVRPVPDDLVDISYYFYLSPLRPGALNTARLRWHVAWEGKAECRIGLLGPGSSVNIDDRAGHGTFAFGSGGGGNTLVTFAIRDRSDPPRNIRIWQDRYDANFRRGERFNPDWLNQVRQFDCLRVMDWMVTNQSALIEFADLADLDYRIWGAPKSAATGPRGGTPLAIIAELANLTGCRIHFCLPHQASDTCIAAIASFFRDHTDVELTYEYSNECWNFQFPQTGYCLQQGEKLWGDRDGARFAKWYGYRAAQCMAIIREVYRDPTRWRGALATQTVNPGVTQAALAGVASFLDQERRSGARLSVTDLFKSLYVTGYFGDVQQAKAISGITRSTLAVATAPRHGFVNGQRLKLFVGAGMTALNDTYVTVAEAAPDSFVLEGIDTSRMAPWASGNNFAIDATVFALMDDSAARHAKDPATYPTRTTWFARQLRDSLITGSCAAGFRTHVSVSSLQQKFWPAQRAIAAANGLDLRQYEGGCHFVGDPYLAGYGGNPQFTEFLLASGHSDEIAEVYGAAAAAFVAAGGVYPSKFVELGCDSQYGTWPGIRFLPGDEDNPVWRAVSRANAV